MNNELTNFLVELYGEYKKKREEIYKLRARDAPDFNPFHFMQNNELGLSKILAFFLDPNASHEQGNVFLAEFLRLLNLDDLDLSYVSVTTEKTLKLSNHRHDIFLSGSNWVMSIENKIYGAVDQEKQITSYIDDMRGNNNEHFYMLYLPAKYKLPEKKSISHSEWSKLEHEGKAKVITPEFLVEWLESSTSQSQNITLFKNSFIDYLKREFLNMKEENNEILEFIKNKPEYISMVLDLSEMNIKGALISDFSFQLGELFVSNYPELINWNIKYNENYIEGSWFIPIRFVEPNGKFAFALEFNKNLTNFIYGVRYEKCMYKKDLEVVASEINSRINWGRGSNQWWVGYHHFDEKYKNFDNKKLSRIYDKSLSLEIWNVINPTLKELMEVISKEL